MNVVGVDFSPVQVERARTWWRDERRVSFVRAMAGAFLTADTATYDAVYSVWGAVWCTDPEELLPLIAARLTDGGVLAFRQAEPTADAWGPQRMGGTWLEGREDELTVLRWQYSPALRTDLLKRSGFADVAATALAAPAPGQPGTLLVRARTAVAARRNG
ncbi:class I SAM-dependent methyltransferase [Streptomyces sp. DSM 44917]|uniref:Class I SAM-dependent methyltransferase n=1 Tax=Streptomyces boetiae TaxID=3075541 RepID=A0ABU2L955_9ACTN|nr:class I SAM-dependent methyltransferase [Streptomyces sp. DSM 44917]MDT0308099.1 class I SAM-dependent methyltransferase [Streptomyces sp. DSM 44917]